MTQQQQRARGTCSAPRPGSSCAAALLYAPAHPTHTHTHTPHTPQREGRSLGLAITGQALRGDHRHHDDGRRNNNNSSSSIVKGTQQGHRVRRARQRRAGGRAGNTAATHSIESKQSTELTSFDSKHPPLAPASSPYTHAHTRTLGEALMSGSVEPRAWRDSCSGRRGAGVGRRAAEGSGKSQRVRKAPGTQEVRCKKTRHNLCPTPSPHHWPPAPPAPPASAAHKSSASRSSWARAWRPRRVRLRCPADAP